MEGWEWEERYLEREKEKKIVETSPLTFRLVSEGPYRGTGFEVHFNVFRPQSMIFFVQLFSVVDESIVPCNVSINDEHLELVHKNDHLGRTMVDNGDKTQEIKKIRQALNK